MTARKPKKSDNVERDARGVLEFNHELCTLYAGEETQIASDADAHVIVPISLWHKARRTAKRMLK